MNFFSRFWRTYTLICYFLRCCSIFLSFQTRCWLPFFFNSIYKYTYILHTFAFGLRLYAFVDECVNSSNIRKHSTRFITVTDITTTELLSYRRHLYFSMKRENRICWIGIIHRVLSNYYYTIRLSLLPGRFFLCFLNE